MYGLGPGGLYYRALDYVARFVQGEWLSPRRRLALLVIAGAVLLSVNWSAANALVLQVGELPGTPGYDRLLYGYLMRLLCGEALIAGAVLLSAAWAQQAGRIPTYPLEEEGE